MIYSFQYSSICAVELAFRQFELDNILKTVVFYKFDNNSDTAVNHFKMYSILPTLPKNHTHNSVGIGAYRSARASKPVYC